MDLLTDFHCLFIAIRHLGIVHNYVFLHYFSLCSHSCPVEIMITI
jgi:hypothetical protein